jgi:hypothetical protein
MSWADTVIATALAALADRTASAGRLFVPPSPGWKPDDVWMRRVRQLRERTDRSSRSEPSTPSRWDTAARDWIPRS